MEMYKSSSKKKIKAPYSGSGEDYYYYYNNNNELKYIQKNDTFPI